MMSQVMVLGIIAREGARALVQGLKVFSKYEGKTYTKLYGISAGRGVRHGLASGGVIGSFLNQGDSLLDDGSVSQNEYGNKTSSSNKARGRFQRYSGRGYSNKSNSRYRKRCSCSRKR